MTPVKNGEDGSMFIGSLVAFESKCINNNTHFTFQGTPNVALGYVDNRNRITCFGKTCYGKSPVDIRIPLSNDESLRMRKITLSEASSLLTEVCLGRAYYAPKEEQKPYEKLQLLANQYFGTLTFIFGQHDNKSIIHTLPKEIASLVVDFSSAL